MLKILDMEKQNREKVNLEFLKLYAQSLFRIQSHLYLFPCASSYPFDAVDLIVCFFMHCTIENAALHQSSGDEAKVYLLTDINFQCCPEELFYQMSVNPSEKCSEFSSGDQ